MTKKRVTTLKVIKPARKPQPKPQPVYDPAKCAVHQAGDECVWCGYGMGVCPYCGVQNVSLTAKMCAACGKKA